MQAAPMAAMWISAATIPEDARRSIVGLWIILTAIWLVGMFMTRHTVRRQTSSSRLWQIGITLLGAWLVFGRGTGVAWMDAAAFPVTAGVAVAGVAIALAGVAFAIWARVTLGANWSGIVTVKEGHARAARTLSNCPASDLHRSPDRMGRHCFDKRVGARICGATLVCIRLLVENFDRGAFHD